jgi:hypothetical protein
MQTICTLARPNNSSPALSFRVESHMPSAFAVAFGCLSKLKGLEFFAQQQPALLTYTNFVDLL